MSIEKRLKKLEKKTPIKKMGGYEGERDTRLDPYQREKINVRDIPDLIEDEDNLFEDDQ